MRAARALVGACLVLFLSPEARALEPIPDARSLIDRVVAAYGGKAALERVKAYRLILNPRLEPGDFAPPRGPRSSS